MVNKYFDGDIPALGTLTASDEAIVATQKRATETSNAAIDSFAINEALAAVWQLVDELNGYITEQQPWALSKDPANRERLGTVLATTVNGLGTLSILLSPVLPKATERLWRAIGGVGNLRDQRIDDAQHWATNGRVTALETSLFPRIEVDTESGTA
jgi:methionyl-tRNA synthetase